MTSQGKVAKYFVVKQEVAANIKSGKYDPSQPIPSERELMDIFQVSRITVRKAIDELVNDGILYRIQGKGTYIKQLENKTNLISLTSCTEDVLNHNMHPSKRLVSLEKIKPDLDLAKLLEITVEDSVFVIGRIQYADDNALNYTKTHIPEKIFPNIDRFDLGNMSLYTLMEKEYGVQITKAQRTLEAVKAKGIQAQYLGVEPGDPIIYFECTTYGIVNGEEVPIEFFKCYYRTDQLKFYIAQHKN